MSHRSPAHRSTRGGRHRAERPRGAVRRALRLPTALTLALVAVGVVALPDGAARAEADPDPLAPVTGAVGAVLDTLGVRTYWSPGRMEAAEPLDLAVGGSPIASSGASASSTAQARAGLVAPRSVGKLFFTTPQGDAVCSASSLSSSTRDLVLTAAHCVHPGGTTACGLLGLNTCAAAYYTNFLFVPRYSNGRGPDGAWVGSRVITFDQWTQNADLDVDQAIIRVAPLGGRRLADVVGANGLAFDHPARQASVAIWGWPAQGPYDGESVQRCTGSTRPFDGTGDAAMACPLTGGASGGPWFLSTVGGDVGYIWGVTSRRTLSGPPTLVAHPIGRGILDLFAGVGSAPSRVSRVAVVAPARAGRVGRPSVRAAEQTVGRGQTLTLLVRARPGTRVVVGTRASTRAPWRRVTVRRVGREGVLRLTAPQTVVGTRFYRVRTAAATSRSERVQVVACPLPLDRGAASRTGCTAPTR